MKNNWKLYIIKNLNNEWAVSVFVGFNKTFTSYSVIFNDLITGFSNERAKFKFNAFSKQNKDAYIYTSEELRLSIIEKIAKHLVMFSTPNLLIFNNKKGLEVNLNLSSPVNIKENITSFNSFIGKIRFEDDLINLNKDQFKCFYVSYYGNYSKINEIYKTIINKKEEI